MKKTIFMVLCALALFAGAAHAAQVEDGDAEEQSKQGPFKITQEAPDEDPLLQNALVAPSACEKAQNACEKKCHRENHTPGELHACILGCPVCN